VVPPLDNSTTYAFSDIDDFARASSNKIGSGYVYTRWANPTVDRFEAAISDLEGSEDAEAFATGMAAIGSVFLAFCSAGDRIVSARQVYGGTYSLLSEQLPRWGIKTETYDVSDHEAIEAALEGATLLYCETIGNPLIQVADLPLLGKLARGHDVPLVVDSTFATPVLCRPLELGAAVVVHSATKYFGGHLDLMGGVVCGDEAAIERVRSTARDLGPTMAPFNAWLALRGLATLELRVERACASADQLARALEQRSDVVAVHYPTLDSDTSRALADDILGGRGGGILGFDLSGGRDRARRFQERLELVQPAASLGGTHSLIVNAASVTHTQLTAEELRAAGISEGFCRLSVGMEDPEDILADIDQALAASKG
jgi:cystathionine beta-lyase/cystathionine gamma-synthase